MRKTRGDEIRTEMPLSRASVLACVAVHKQQQKPINETKKTLIRSKGENLSLGPLKSSRLVFFARLVATKVKVG